MKILDASVLAPLCFDHELSEQALGAINHDDEIIIPSLAFVEVANTIWKYVRAGQFKPSDYPDLEAVINALVSSVHTDAGLIEDALRMAISEEHPVYDCVYLVLAVRTQAQLITADRKMARLAEQVSIPTTVITPS